MTILWRLWAQHERLIANDWYFAISAGAVSNAIVYAAYEAANLLMGVVIWSRS